VFIKKYLTRTWFAKVIVKLIIVEVFLSHYMYCWRSLSTLCHVALHNDSDVNKDWTCKDKDKDKDLVLVLKESLRTRINITE